MQFPLPARLAVHFPVCPVCRSADRELVLRTDGQVSCADTAACAKDVQDYAEWCDKKAEEMSAQTAMEHGIPVW